MEESKFNLTVRSREGVIFQGEVASFSSVNDRGKFDVLQEHANFISLIKDSIVIRDLKGEQREIKISNGLLRARDNNLEVYLGVGETKFVGAKTT